VRALGSWQQAVDGAVERIIKANEKEL